MSLNCSLCVLERAELFLAHALPHYKVVGKLEHVEDKFFEFDAVVGL